MADGAAAGRARSGAVCVGGVWARCAARVVHARGDGMHVAMVIGGGGRVCVVARLCDGAGRRG